LEKDIRMMKEAGINVIRIAKSTWSTAEPQDGILNFTHIDRVLQVIVGTPLMLCQPGWFANTRM